MGKKSCGKKKKTQKTVIDVWNVFKRKVEKYVEYLYCYFKQENKMHDFYCFYLRCKQDL